MTVLGRDVLLVGECFHNAKAWTDLLGGWGFRCHFAGTVQVARELFGSVRIDMVLTNTNLPDGTGFGLVVGLSGRPVTALICLPVENSCFWVPAVDVGRVCLGLPSLRPDEFARALKDIARRLPPEPRVIPAALAAVAS